MIHAVAQDSVGLVPIPPAFWVDVFVLPDQLIGIIEFLRHLAAIVPNDVPIDTRIIIKDIVRQDAAPLLVAGLVAVEQGGPAEPGEIEVRHHALHVAVEGDIFVGADVATQIIDDRLIAGGVLG